MYIIVNSPPPPSPMTPSKVIFNKWHIIVEDAKIELSLISNLLEEVSVILPRICVSVDRS